MKPLLPGKDSTKQYDLIIRRFGKLSDAEIQTVPDGMVRKYLNKINASAKINGDLEAYIGAVPVELSPCVDTLIRSLVRFDPRDRSSADALIHSDLFRQFRTPYTGRGERANI